jgi:hypothetical protein
MRNIREACRVVSFLSPIAGTLALGANRLQAGGASKAPATPALKTAARPKAPSTPVGIVITRMGGN